MDATFAAVTTGDADAAIVYVTNAKTIGSQGVGIPIPTSQNVTTSYPIAVVKSTTDRALAEAWIAYVLGPTGQSVLRQASFLPASLTSSDHPRALSATTAIGSGDGGGHGDRGLPGPPPGRPVGEGPVGAPCGPT